MGFACLSAVLSIPAHAGVSREVEAEYRGRYVNRAIFLRLPVFGERQVAYVRGGTAVPDPGSASSPLIFRVGEQVRITQIDFRDSDIEFRLSAVDLSRRSVLVFSFGQSLTQTFPQRDQFEAALAASFTEGLTYRDLEQAKEDYVKNQFQRQIQQFAATTGSDTETVIESMLAVSPKYRELQSRTEEAEAQTRRLDTALKEQQAARTQAETELESTRRRLTELERTGSATRRERDEAVAERDRLRRELQDQQASSRRIQEQVSAAAAKLDVQVDSNSQLSRQVQTLTQNIEALQKERTDLSQRATRLGEQLSQVTRERDKLSADLSSATRENAKLQGDLSALTSNRESLQATYLRTRDDRDRLEAADQLAAAMDLRWSAGPARNGNGPVADIVLGNQRLGRVELTPPLKSGESAIVKLVMDSPDTVQFSEDERRLFDALGKQLKVEASWTSWSGAIQPVLVEGEALRTVAPREEATWTWSFAGVPQQPEKLGLRLTARDANGLAVPLGEYQVEMAPAGLAGLMAGFSLPWLLGGALLGSLLGGGLIALTRRQAMTPRSQGRSYSSEKAL